MKIKKILVYLWNKFFDIKISVTNKLLIFKDSIFSRFQKTPSIKSIEETINYIIENRASVSRYGDGEFKLINGLDIAFQKNNNELQKKLASVLKVKEDKFIVCIPDVFSSLNQYADEPRAYWKLHMAKYRKEWCRVLNLNINYGNAFISRCYYSFKDKNNSEKYFNLLKKIWNDRNIVLVEGAKSRLGIGNDLFNNVKGIERILVPEINAFNKYDEIINEVKKLSKDKLILLAAGPTATVLAYDLYKEGYQAIDIGHVDIEYEWFLRKAETKIKIENKFVCEAGFGEGVGELDNNEYKKQILAQI